MADLTFTLIDSDFLSESERGELERLRHHAAHYGANMTQRALDRLNWLEVADQRDQLWRALAAEREAGAAEVRARVEAVLRSSWSDVRTHGDAAAKIRAALNGGAS